MHDKKRCNGFDDKTNEKICRPGIVFKCKKETSDGKYDRLSCYDTLTGNIAGADNVLINTCLVDNVSSDINTFSTGNTSVAEGSLAEHCKIDKRAHKIDDDLGRKILYNRTTVLYLMGDCKTCM